MGGGACTGAQDPAFTTRRWLRIAYNCDRFASAPSVRATNPRTGVTGPGSSSRHAQPAVAEPHPDDAQLFEKLPPVSNKTDWYIDFTWCKMTRLLLPSQFGCAILNPVLLDLDFASLDASGTGNGTYVVV